MSLNSTLLESLIFSGSRTTVSSLIRLQAKSRKFFAVSAENLLEQVADKARASAS